MKKKLFFVCTLLILTLLLLSCAPLRERVEGGISTEGLYVGMPGSDFWAYLEEHDYSGSCYLPFGYCCFMDEWGDTVIVRTSSPPVETQIVEDIIICEPKEPQQKSYLDEHVKVGMALEDLIEIAGKPTGLSGGENPYLIFAVADNQELCAYFNMRYDFATSSVSTQHFLTDFFFI